MMASGSAYRPEVKAYASERTMELLVTKEYFHEKQDNSYKL
jgi:hypothetical protein